jgi:hypothetical protein
MKGSDGRTWIGRRPYLAIPVLFVLIPIYVAVGMVHGIWQVFVESWWPDFKEVTRKR